MICKHCKKEISPNDTFCPYCGKSTKNSSMSKSKKAAIWIIVIAAVAAAGIVTCALAINNKNKQSSNTEPTQNTTQTANLTGLQNASTETVATENTTESATDGTPQAAKQALSGESVWTDNLAKAEKSFADRGITQTGDEYIWFQDIDMDGTPEFVVMSKDSEDVDTTNRFFEAYNCKDGFELYESKTDSNITAEFYSHDNSLTDDDFKLQLWQKGDGSFAYINSENYGDGTSVLNELVLDDGAYYHNIIESMSDNDSFDFYSDFNFYLDNVKKVTADEAVKYYNNYFNNAIKYDTNTQKIKLGDYQNKDNSEKEKLLTDSYNAWSYTQAADSTPPLQKEISERVNSSKQTQPKTETETASPTADYKQLYKNELERLSTDPKKTTVEYTLYDMNNDGIPEMPVITGTCQADYKLSFYSIVNGKLTLVGDNFSGFNTMFYKDNASGDFCMIMQHMETGTITRYTFDGSTVTEGEALEFDNINDTADSHGDFSSLAMEEMEGSDGNWRTYVYPANMSDDNYDNNEVAGKDYSMIDNY